MDRRTFVRGGVGLAAGTGLAGCLGLGSEAPPPRKAKVFDDVTVSGSTLQVKLLAQPEVESRATGGSSDPAETTAVESLVPVGVARAAKGGRGATGRGSGGYSSAPKGRHGWAVWHGGDYEDEWREEHDDELRMYPANVALLGAAWLGTTARYEDEAPGPGEEPLDRRWSDPEEGTTKRVDLRELSPTSTLREGWYRLEVDLESRDGDVDFGKQSADVKVDDEGNGQIEKAWHVKPRV